MKKLLFVFTAIWFGISVLRTINNFSKVLIEEKQWIVLTEDQKRKKIFGDFHPFLKFVERNTLPESSIVFLAPGGKAFYLGRYYLYPRKLVYVKSSRELEETLKNCSFSHVLEYQTNNPNLNENNSLSWNVLNKKKISEYISRENYNYIGTLFQK